MRRLQYRHVLTPVGLAIGLGMSWTLVLAQAGGDFQIRRSAIGGGAGAAAGAGFAVTATVGQPEAGPMASGGGFELRGGFWAAAVAPLADGVFADGFE